MKKLILITAILIGVVNSKAQITLDTIVTPLGIGYDFYTVQISPDETKYYVGDTSSNTFSLYNMDFSPFMTNIPVPEPFNNFNLQVLYVSRTLFDCDSSNIEYAYAAPVNSLKKPFRIVRVDGTVLFQLDSALGVYCAGGCLGYSDIVVPIRNTSDGAKLFLAKSDLNGGQRIHIYSLCGKLSTDVFHMPQNNNYVAVFPNPNNGLLNFQVSLPDNINEYELVIVDAEFKEIKREKVTASNTSFLIDMSTFSSGNYYYSLGNKNKNFQSGKFILTK